MDTTTLLEQLRQPFAPSAISWKPGATKGDKCMALAYADLRAYQERLDELMGLDWSVRYIFWGDNRIACELTLYVGDALGRREGITRSSIGESDAQDEKNNMAGSVSEAMAFKRAAAMFGLGRYLYELPAAWVGFDATTKKISKEGQAELDRRYADWYTKKMAALAKRHPPHVDTETGEIIDSELTRIASIMARGPNSEEEPIEGDVLFAKDEAHGSPPHQRMWGIGKAVFGNDWDMARPWVIRQWTHAFSQPKRSSAADLTDDEKTMLGDYLNESASKLQQLWPAQKKVMEQRAAANAQEPIATVA